MINQIYDEKICSWLRENRETILEKWMDLVRIPSVRSEAAPDAPYGIYSAQALNAAAGYFSQEGIPVRINKEGGYALAHIGEGEKCIGLFGHSDVVPAGDGWLFAKPFEPEIREGMLIGRGTFDNKSGVMASWCVLTMLKECGIPVNSRIQAFIGSAEESRMPDMEAFVKNETAPDLSLVPDAAFPCALGEKGILRIWTRCDTPFRAILDMQGGKAMNIVLDRVDVVLAPNADLEAELLKKCAGNESYEVKIDADGTIRLAANGVAKHGAYPMGSVNATWLAAKLLACCENLPEQDRKILADLEEYLASYYGEGMGIAYDDPNFGQLTAVNGMTAMDGGHLKIGVDIRYGTGFPPQDLENALHNKWQEIGWHLVDIHNRPGYCAQPGNPVPHMLKDIYDQFVGRESNFYYMAGGTYARHLPNAFVVGSAALHESREAPGSFLPAGHGGAHQRDEAIDIESFFLGVRVLAHYVLACDAYLNP